MQVPRDPGSVKPLVNLGPGIKEGKIGFQYAPTKCSPVGGKNISSDGE
jgi:hypothetical protein